MATPNYALIQNLPKQTPALSGPEAVEMWMNALRTAGQFQLGRQQAGKIAAEIPFVAPQAEADILLRQAQAAETDKRAQQLAAILPFLAQKEQADIANMQAGTKKTQAETQFIAPLAQAELETSKANTAFKKADMPQVEIIDPTTGERMFVPKQEGNYKEPINPYQLKANADLNLKKDTLLYENMLKERTTATDQAIASQTTIDYVNKANAALDKIPFGTGALSGSLQDKLNGTAAQEFKTDLENIVLSLSAQNKAMFGSRLSNMGLKLIQDTKGALTKTVAANKNILAGIKLSAERNEQYENYLELMNSRGETDVNKIKNNFVKIINTNPVYDNEGTPHPENVYSWAKTAFDNKEQWDKFALDNPDLANKIAAALNGGKK